MTNPIYNFIDSLWLNMCRYSEKVKEAVNYLNNETQDKLDIDHIAFRTFNCGPLRLEKLSSFLIDAGYHQTGEYLFHDKHVRAKSFSHILENVPRIFLSELIIEELSDKDARDICVSRVLSLKPLHDRTWQNTFGRTWWSSKFTQDEANKLNSVSEYALWVALHGLQPNHFAFRVGPKFSSVARALNFLEEKGFAISNSGGRIKGGPTVLLEQGSLKSEWTNYPGLIEKYPVGYLELVRRFIDAKTGTLFDGFIDHQADRIFESTYKIK